jgi:hypothetical protein
MLFVISRDMEKERSEEQLKLMALNKRFLEEIERGSGWEDVKNIMEEMKEIARRIDHIPATVISFDDYPLNKTSESANG